ncbi:uncharacterized protein LOC129581192 [Paramacrobiotus metropolitanus]|uniref:uncharacterized protein LOC129581192 n=1 Tax=Paramacrobiotus metropolitanus TaxID=2943436 RepID=UPI0024456539|nr:uncharacterized protein LOC129581192 [Paramacrobiotus metropolitanus]
MARRVVFTGLADRLSCGCGGAGKTTVLVVHDLHSIRIRNRCDCCSATKPSSVISAYLEQQGRWLSKIVFEDILMAVATFASIDLWRGVWGLYDEYFFPWDIVTSAWLSHIFGFFGLALMFHSNSAVMKGFQYDGEHSDGAGCWFPAKCLSVFDHFIQPSSDDPGGEGTDSNDSGNNQRSSAASLTQAMATQPVITVDDLAHGDPCETAKLRPLRRSHNSLHRLPSNSDINGLNADDVAWADPDELRKLRRTTFRSHYPHPDLSLMRKTSLISDRLSRADRLHTPITPIDSLVGHTNQNTQIS